MRGRIPEELILAIYATSKGFAFVLFEGPESPFDWGVRDIRNPSRNRKCIEAIEKIFEQYQPGILVIEDTSDRLSRRTARIRRLYQSLTHLAKTNVIDVYRCPKDAIRKTFGSVGAVTKHEIAQAIARQIPAFSIRLPRVRKPWMSQDSRQGLFDAAALGICYYAHAKAALPSDDVLS
jgi:Holliday junction resolvasome RuvABC endonuclease subunit